MKNKNKQSNLSKEVKYYYKKIPQNVKYISFWIIGLVILYMVLSYFFPLVYDLMGVGKIKYEGLTFTKEYSGEKPNRILFYHYYYLYQNSKGEIIQNNIYLRNDPSKNKINVSDEIVFNSGQSVKIGIDTDNLVKCNQSSLALSGLSSFIRNADHNVSGGTLNKTESINQNISFVECKESKDMVIKILWSYETFIEGREDCYQIHVSSCEDILPASEKFIVQSIIDAKNRQ